MSVNHKDVCYETLEALYMSPKGLERWFDRMERFCSKNGGDRYYGEILEIVKEYRDTLDAKCPERKE
ncbi:MAG: hypothetical protein OEZ36_12580, partial [Spirochaetota bacterium]|nr:hypothetical protein [Spirochaetota bacterium]